MGTPFQVRYPADAKIYARNIWDIRAYKGKLYLGGGNSSNKGPARNAGPVPVIGYSPEENRFYTSYMTNEEQIDAIYIFNDRLYIPGHDPRENWSLGNLYTYHPEESWTKLRTIPQAIHSYALAQYQGKLFAALGSSNGNSVTYSTDWGRSWQQIHVGIKRVYNFILVDGRLFAVGTLLPDNEKLENKRPPSKATVFEIQTSNAPLPRPDLNPQAILFPGENHRSQKKFKKISKSISLKKMALYIGADIVNDHQARPFGAYMATSFARGAVAVKKISLPQGAIPWDLLKHGNTAYILISEKTENGYRVSVQESTDGNNWKELLYFDSPAFARSFEKLEGYFYFGLGDEISEGKGGQDIPLNTATGAMYRVKIPPGHQQ